MALVLENFQGEGHVVGGERAAVVKLDAGPHQEAIGEPVLGYLHRAGCKPVQAIRLVLGRCHQAREGELHALGAIAPEDETVERIEGEKILVVGAGRSDMGEHAALRRIGLDIVEMLEVRRIFEIAEGRHAMALGAFVRPRGHDRHRCQRARAQQERIPAADLAGGFAHCRVPALAAFSASHHHTVGNAAAPYLGNGSGRPNRSHRAVRVLSKVNCGTT